MKHCFVNNWLAKCHYEASLKLIGAQHITILLVNDFLWLTLPFLNIFKSNSQGYLSYDKHNVCLLFKLLKLGLLAFKVW